MDLRVLAIFVIVAFLHPMTTKVTILCYYFLSIESLGASLNRSIASNVPVILPIFSTCPWHLLQELQLLPYVALCSMLQLPYRCGLEPPIATTWLF